MAHGMRGPSARWITFAPSGASARSRRMRLCSTQRHLTALHFDCMHIHIENLQFKVVKSLRCKGAGYGTI